jgi:NADPH:quinone reductase-like Zn-dependent oxidoreductase
MTRRVYAAVVKTLGQVPRYELIDLPPPSTNQVQVQVIAAGAHRVVRAIASGRHYVKPKTMPLIPGIDGVGTLSNGKKIYFISMNGSMSEHVNVDHEMIIDLPDIADPIVFAAIMNAGLGSWTALRERARIKPGETVLILGVTGSSGQMAATSAHLLGAKRVVGVGRNKSVLDQLVANGTIDAAVALDNDEAIYQQAIETEAANVDIVIDYLWGRPTEITMAGIQSARKDAAQRLRWVEVGQMAGANIQFSAGFLRSKNIEIIGSGFGSIPLKEILNSLKHMVPMVMGGKLTTSVIAIPLKDIEQKWEETAETDERVVVVM